MQDGWARVILSAADEPPTTGPAALFFDGSSEQTAHDAVLEQDHHDIDRDHADDDPSRNQTIVNRALVGPEQAQGQLYRTVVRIHEDQREQIFIPDIDEIQDQHRDDARQADREKYVIHDLQDISAIHHGALFQFARQLAHETAQQDY